MTARKWLTFVEIDVSICSLTFNRPPCMAVLEGQVLGTVSYAFLDTVLSWSASDATVVAGADAAIYTQTGAGPKLLTPSLTIDGATDYIIRLDIERTANRSSGTWDGTVYYTTGGHGESASYRKTFPEITLAQGRQFVEIDMSALTAGGTDWTTNTITQIRFDFDSGGSGAFKIYSAQIGHYASADEATGSQRCFNSFGSCQDRANYDESFVTLRFVKDVGYQAESGIEALPSLTSVNITPGRMAPGEGLGQRPSAVFTFREHADSDTGPGYDKYLSTRTFDPSKQGQYWAKLAKRHPNLRGKRARLIQGYLGQSLAEMETRHYIIDSADGPGLDGAFTVTAKDPLKALDGDRAVLPTPSLGYLNADITAGATSATLAPTGIGDEDYAASGELVIGSEWMTFTRSGDTLTLTRGQQNTTAETHKSGDTVQEALVIASEDAASILNTLFSPFVDSAYIPLTDWTSEVSNYNGQVYTRRIGTPTSVKKLAEEIIVTAALNVWWDEIDQQIKLQVLKAISTDAFTFDESLVQGLSIKAQPDKRKSQIWTYFAPRDPLKPADLTNFPGRAVLADADAEAEFGSAQIRTITSNWIQTGGRSIAEWLNAVVGGRYRNAPREISFKVPMTEGAEIPVMGGGYQMMCRPFQDVAGAPEAVPFQVISTSTIDGVVSVVGEEFVWTDYEPPDPLNRFISIDYAVYNRNIRTMHDDLYGTPTPKGTVTLVISSAARVGSTSTSVPALQTGTWPSRSFTATRSTSNGILTGISDTSAFAVGQAVTGSGIPNDARVMSIVVNTSVTIDKTPTIAGSASLTLWDTILNIVDAGQIIGAGGPGGRGRGGDDNTGGAGTAGGTGLKATSPVNLSGAGKVDGGGGGGGGGGGDYRGWFGPQQNGGGGGGGAGDVAGSGGARGASDADVGQAGTLEAGGTGGDSNYSNFKGGDGGDPGQAGNDAVGDFAGSGAAAGKSVDGASLVKDSAFTGAYRGAQIN
jgi:hypothetical protein